jgi:predicted Rossmann fold nucleotide-binding protein DprA/Smf involved in DNA uptake
MKNEKIVQKYYGPNTDDRYPVTFKRYSYLKTSTIWALGDFSISQHKPLALFCSVKCPGNLILQTYDLARTLRDTGVTVISGFHSPMEKECLSLLLKGEQPLIICPARRLSNTRLPKKYAVPMKEGRLLLLSPFEEKTKRVTVNTANIRNEFVAALADKVFVSYAAPGSKTASFCKKILQWGKPLFTFDAPENKSLLEMGAKPLNVSDFPF